MTGDAARAGDAAQAWDGAPAGDAARGAGAARVDPPGRPAPPDPPMLPFALAGTAMWALLGLALLPFRGRLQADGHGSWLWICLAGVLIGFVGIAVMRRYDLGRRHRHGDG